MRTLYLDCGMGAAGDMLTAALLELLPEPETFVEHLNGLGLPMVEYMPEKVQKCGIQGTHMSVRVCGMEEAAGDAEGDRHDHEYDYDHDHNHDHGHDHDYGHEHDCGDNHDHNHPPTHEGGEPGKHHHHSSIHDIEHIVERLEIPEQVKRDVLEIYVLIAEAESSVHGVPVEKIHFHEVGSLDAVADVVAVCLLMHRLAPERVVASPVNLGSGQVKCAHGILPVPAPATAYILRGVPVYGSGIRGELCTPTGAALLRHFVTEFGDMPLMTPEAVGYGMGKKDFERANCVRAMLGESVVPGGEADGEDIICELDCNVDDMTAEAVGFAMERLFTAGAREVYVMPVYMKKSRPGMLICVMCLEQDKEKLLQCIFAHTTTIGIRERRCRRHVLDRVMSEVGTPWGTVHYKTSAGYGVKRFKPEYEDLAGIAREQGVSLEEVRKWVDKYRKDV
ncbi:MAG: nickel pincer cofactor biosynthesis protein LarC [Acetatifactor sp.]